MRDFFGQLKEFPKFHSDLSLNLAVRRVPGTEPRFWFYAMLPVAMIGKTFGSHLH